MLIYLFQWFQFIVQEPLVLTSPRQDHFALRSQKRGGLLGTGTGGGGGGGGGGGRGRKSEGSTADTARKRPERPWTAARTMEVLRRCPHRAIAVSTSVLGQIESQGQCPLHCSWATTRSERSLQLSQPSSTFLLMISSGLTWRSSSTSLL